MKNKMAHQFYNKTKMITPYKYMPKNGVKYEPDGTPSMSVNSAEIV